jgi:tetratricopeptide (TPR) repeat protein
LFVRVLDLRRRAQGEAHPFTIESMKNLAGLYQVQSQYDKAEPLYRVAYQATREREGASSIQAASAQATLGLCLLQQKKFSEAESTLRECLAIREKLQPADWTTFSTKSLLGGSLLGQKKYADAEPLLLAGYEGMKQRAANAPKVFKLRFTEATERLVQLYDALGQKEKADEWRKQLAAAKPPAKPE